MGREKIGKETERPGKNGGRTGKPFFDQFSAKREQMFLAMIFRTNRPIFSFE